MAAAVASTVAAADAAAVIVVTFGRNSLAIFANCCNTPATMPAHMWQDSPSPLTVPIPIPLPLPLSLPSPMFAARPMSVGQWLLIESGIFRAAAGPAQLKIVISISLASDFLQLVLEFVRFFFFLRAALKLPLGQVLQAVLCAPALLLLLWLQIKLALN